MKCASTFHTNVGYFHCQREPGHDGMHIDVSLLGERVLWKKPVPDDVDSPACYAAESKRPSLWQRIKERWNR